MRQILCAGVIALAAVIISATGPVEAQGVRRGANYFPNLPVVTQDGKTLKFYDDVIKGKIVLISFIYTNCPDMCPLTTARISQVEDALGDMVGRDIFFISMTVDPVRDMPERLKEFAKAFDAGPGWLFLTGKPEDIKLINASLGDRSHTIGVGDRVGPDLRGVTERCDHAWLADFIMHPDKARARHDPIAMSLKKK